MPTVLSGDETVCRVRVHLSHTCESPLLAHSVGTRTIMETLGYSIIIAITPDTYGHVMATTLTSSGLPDAGDREPSLAERRVGAGH